MLVRIANREDLDLCCLSRPFWQATSVQILEHLPYMCSHLVYGQLTTYYCTGSHILQGLLCGGNVFRAGKIHLSASHGKFLIL